VGGQDAHLGDVMNYGFTEIFVRPMLWVLKAVHRAFGNYGIAIILLTMLIKLVTWWPTAQSMKSAQAMAKLKPEIDKLKEKYGDDKQKINTEMMQLYAKHKINPIGGCLPVLLQMPIYIALYSMLGNSVELYGAHFLWIKDLTAPEGMPPILPLLTGVLMFVQQKLSPTAVDPSQKQMMTIMPIMFTGMSLFLPAGLTLYILTNTVLSIAQQRISAPMPAATNDANASKKKKA
jgi:YidC/Oxa1 family membrane protein insertase